MKLNVDFATQTRLFLGLYEREIQPYIREFCRLGFCCFDIGAGNGYYALVFAKLTRGRVYAFEADKPTCAAFAENLKLNATLADVVQCFCTTVASQTIPQTETVSIDDFVGRERTRVPDVVKIDTDGAEVDVLFGAERILNERQPHLIVETHSADLEQKCMAMLRRASYEPTVINQRKLFPDYRPIPHNRWLVAKGRARSSARRGGA